MARDRDLSFEKALAKNLRSAGAKPAGPRDACADAEMLAAYHERSLAPSESASLKQHISACARCQEILAQLEATDALPVESLDPVPTNVLATPNGPGARKTITTTSKPRWVAPWRWLVPAGAFSAALLVWIVIHEEKLPNVQVAKNDALPASATPKAPAPLSRSEIAEAGPKNSSKLAPQREPEAPSTNTRGFAGETQRRQSTLRDKDVTPRKVQAPAPSDNAIAQDSFNNMPALDQTNADEKLKAHAKADKIAPLPSPKPPQPQALESAMNAPMEQKRADSQPLAGVVGGAAGSETLQQRQEMGGRSLYAATSSRAKAAVVLAKSKGLGLITAPGGKVLWRVGPAGMIERSADAGTTWMLQSSGVVNDLLTGSAPSEKVCWIVGRAGTILRTTDGGALWQKVPSPTTGDLTSLFAVDAQQATVSAGQDTYQTSDGGLTWKKLSPE